MPHPETLSPEQFARFRDLIEHRCGIHLDDAKKQSLELSLRSRMAQLGMERFLDYYQGLVTDASEAEFRELVNLVTIGETYFFRDPHQFQALRARILPALLREKASRNQKWVRIWSAGCSTGEEPYSVAMILWELGLYSTHSDWTFDIAGTDVSTHALRQARRGLYSSKSVRNVEGDWLSRYFVCEGPQFRLKDEVKQCVQFRFLNLTREPFPLNEVAGQDVILCKNVTIYFRLETTRRLMAYLFRALNEGGHLFIGHSESLWQISDQFRLQEYDGTFCYQKGKAAPVPPLRPPRPRTPVARGHGRQAAKRPEPPRPPPSVEEAKTEYERCLEMFHSGATERLENRLESLIESSPAFVRGHLLLSVLYASRGRYEAALERAQRVLRLDEFEAKAHLVMGMVEARRGRSDEAILSLRRALYLDDSLALAHFWLGNLYLDAGDQERARREYENVLRIYQRHALEWPEEFRAELTVEQLVNLCRRKLDQLPSQSK